ncbi:MAG: hypothetical protein E7319_02560 [Clostridiales bacterium]|nr:hypothetical protein [Clostridiales bacterium]
MQEKKKKKPFPEKVVKPILQGSWNGREAWKMVPGRMLSILSIALLYLFCIIMLGFNNNILRIVTSVVIIIGATYYQWVRGIERGEKDASFGEILYNRQQEGKTVAAEDLDRSFHPLKGLFVTLIALIPFVAVCLIYAFMAQRATFQLGVLPSWTQSLQGHNEFSDALNYYGVKTAFTFTHLMRIIVRTLIMPFVNIATVVGNDAVLLIERLSPLCVIIAPLGYPLGYSRGHEIRSRINTRIKIADAKKKRRERKARRQRQRSSSPERLI